MSQVTQREQVYKAGTTACTRVRKHNEGKLGKANKGRIIQRFICSNKKTGWYPGGSGEPLKDSGGYIIFAYWEK